MTRQFREIIYYKGEKKKMKTLPLSHFFKKNPKIQSKFKKMVADEPMCTALFRMYIGTWEIKDDEYLYLKKIEDCNREEIKLFKNTEYSLPLKANFFSGKLIVVNGPLTKLINSGFYSKYEKYLIIEIEKGKVIKVSDVKQKDLNKVIF